MYLGDDFYCDVAIPKKVNLYLEYEDEFVLTHHHTRPQRKGVVKFLRF